MSLLTIKFSIHCQTQFGQVVYICGNTPQLGNWNHQNAMRLYTDARVYPRWDPYKTICVRQGSKLLFKLCIVNQDRNVRWEGIQGNRQIVASENLLVEFTAHSEDIVVTPVVEEIVRPPRKKTCDILNELQSDGSSSKEYWKQFMEEEEQSVLYLTVTTQMRRIIETQTFWTLPLEKISHSIEAKLILDPPLHSRTQRTRQLLLTTSNFYCISQGTLLSQPISFLGQDSYLVRLQQFTTTYSIHNNLVPIVFHIESLKKGQEDQSLREVFAGVERIVKAENILLGEKMRRLEWFVTVRVGWMVGRDIVEMMVRKRVGLALVDREEILQHLLQHLLQLNLPITTSTYPQLLVHLTPTCIMKLKLTHPTDPQLLSLNPNTNKKQRVHHENKYFEFVKRYLWENNAKSFIGWSKEGFIESVKEDETLVGLASNRKNVLVINADRIEDFTGKLLTEIIALSAKPNFQVYIILEKISLDIKTKFPASKNNKIVVLSKSGTLYANEQTFIDLFQHLNLEKNKFVQAISKVFYAVSLGVKEKKMNGQIESVYQFKRNHSGSIGIEILKEKVAKHNDGSLYKLVLQQKEGKKYVIKPFCLTEEFFIKAIYDNLAKYTHDDRSLILNVNTKPDNHFFQKSTTIFTKTFPQNKQISPNQSQIIIKMRNIQVLATNENDYTGVVRQETIPVAYLQAELEFMCEHFLAGSHIKSYKLDILSPNRNRRSFANRIVRKDQRYQTF